MPVPGLIYPNGLHVTQSGGRLLGPVHDEQAGLHDAQLVLL